MTVTRRPYALPLAVAAVLALAGCPAPSDTTPPPVPTTTVAPAPTTARPTVPPVDPTGVEDDGEEPATVPPRRATTRPRTTPPTADADPTEPVTGAGYDSCAELRVDYTDGVPAEHPAYETRFDPDRDRWACEPA